MMDMRDIDLYHTLVRERQAEIQEVIRTHTLLKGGPAAGRRRKALLALIGLAGLIAIAVVATGAQFFGWG